MRLQPGDASIMRPDLCWMSVSVLAALVVCSHGDGDDSECTPEITVQRHTSYKAVVGNKLEIHCTVTFCDKKTPQVSWNKNGSQSILINSSSRIKTEWKQFNETYGISYLIFENILRNDSGKFQCVAGGQPSYLITVTVHEDEDSNPEDTMEWLYVYSAAGVAAFVLVVIVVSVVAMRGCKGKSKKEQRTDNQYMVMPVVEQPPPQAPPRGSPSIPPSRRSTQRKTQPHGDQDGGRGRSAAKEQPEAGPSLVYAALNHQVPPRGGARPRRPAETPSEYAAIRVA